jgi:hypothetical protein
MVQVEFHRAEQLSIVTYSQHVDEGEVKAALEQIKQGLPEMNPGFRLLTDLCDLESMDPSCAVYIGQTMELFNGRGVGSVARVIPDPSKDIGFNLMTKFHYSADVPVRTFESCKEARESLGLSSVSAK